MKGQQLVMERRTALGLAGAAMLMGATRGWAQGAGWTKVEALAADFLAKGFSPGVAITAARDGQPFYSKGFGMANLETGAAVTPASVFRIGSVTKQFTGAALALLEAEGKLSLNDRLAKFLPAFPGAAEVTLLQMLHHTSGYGNYTNQKNPADFHSFGRLNHDPQALEDMMREQTNPMFVFSPGTDWRYSNTAYVLLGRVIERVTGAPYADYFAKRLFAPAGLIATAVDNEADVVPNRASGYSAKKGDPKAFVNADFISMTVPGAAGNIRSTTEDLCRWHSALFGGKILPPAALKRMLQPGVLNNGKLPMVPADRAKPDEKKPMSYSLGLFTQEIEGRKFIEHGGGIFGFISAMGTFPAERISIAVLTNSNAQEREGYAAAHKALVDTANRAAVGLL
ncbi:serine hydrolase domain-containing protein [Sandaracinobacter neustonicus]|nr:serine hydrolase domain-containing protein [Sandaracinobacter neustonicus]